MENSNNTFLAAKAAIAAVCGAFTAAFGWLGWLVVAWAVCKERGLTDAGLYKSEWAEV